MENISENQERIFGHFEEFFFVKSVSLVVWIRSQSQSDE
jgi:hypothetical protein